MAKNENGYQLLATAIVGQAIKDYQEALRRLEMNPSYRSAIEIKKDVETFFASNWHTYLCRVNPAAAKMLLKEIHE